MTLSLQEIKIAKKIINDYEIFLCQGIPYICEQKKPSKHFLYYIQKGIWRKHKDNKVHVFVDKINETYRIYIQKILKPTYKNIIDNEIVSTVAKSIMPKDVYEQNCKIWNKVQGIIGTNDYINFEEEYIKYKLIKL